MGSEFQFHSWRVFVLVCALPAVAALIGLTFMPESPRFLLEHAKHDEAWMILKHVHDTNWRAKGEPERVFTVSQIKTPKTQEDGSLRSRPPQDVSAEMGGPNCHAYQTGKPIRRNVASLLAPDLRLATLLMSVIWFNMAFRFLGIEMKSVRFEDSLFEDCYFRDIRSTDTYFENCTFRSTIFYNTDLNKENFIDCTMDNTSFLHPQKGCHLNTEEKNDVLIYLVSFLGSLAVLPGNIISAMFMDKIGRIKMIGGSMLISASCTFFLFLSFSQAAIIALQCLFCGVSIETLRLAIRYISYLSAQLHLRVAHYQNPEFRSPHHDAITHTLTAENLETEAFHIQHNQPLEESWTPQSDKRSPYRLYSEDVHGHVTLQSESGFIPQETGQRGGIKVGNSDSDGIFGFHTLTDPRLSHSHQDFGEDEQRERTAHDVWI
ncbi:Synaptic vesicle glycoprotein 2B [Bagarius yarrelli]|uniref:Synaptic vesicle glycoprotein 2B n=1 Tax=Bagarius yarrelli TaxID=175774 RepID=A0A556VWW8_BAGYA|nr:Synaptic vesicle glycoprotein 2B [Bagarius yarrelli]